MNLTNVTGRHAVVREKLLAAAGFNGNGKPSSVITVRHSKASVLEFTGITPSKLKWVVYQGDCNAALAMIPEKSINCVVTSPPYYCQRDYGVEGQIGHEV